MYPEFIAHASLAGPEVCITEGVFFRSAHVVCNRLEGHEVRKVDDETKAGDDSYPDIGPSVIAHCLGMHDPAHLYVPVDRDPYGQPDTTHHKQEEDRVAHVGEETPVHIALGYLRPYHLYCICDEEEG